MLFLREFIGMKFVACLAASLSLIKIAPHMIFCLSTCEGIDRLIIKLWEGWKCRSAFNEMRWIFSSPDMKAQFSFSDRPLSVVCPSVWCLSVTLLQFRLLIQNRWVNYKQSWHKSSLGKGDSELFIWRENPFLWREVIAKE